MRPSSESRRPRRFGIRFRVVAAATVVVAITLVASSAAVIALMQQSLIASLDAAQLARAREVAAQLTTAPANSIIRSTGTDASAIQVIDVTGKVVASTANLEGEDPMPPRPPTQRKTESVTVADSPVDTGASVRVSIAPVTLSNGSGWVYVASSLSQVDAATSSLITLFSVGVPAVVIIVALIAALAVRRALSPVEKIRRRTETISAADLSERVPVPGGNDEISHLATTMNSMLARLELAATRQQQFIGDASHELRSPLTALQTQLDVAIAHTNDPETTRVLPKLRDQVRRMTILIEDLLFLAQSTERSAQVVPTPVDLDELVLAEADRLRQLGALTVDLRTVNAARVQGSYRDLTRMLRNLGDNAYDHATSTITLALTTTDQTAEISVTDDGPGVAAKDREQIFARFSRVDDARARYARGGGSGLGLSIARDIVLTCDGTITVQERPDGATGAVFVVRIPLSN